MSIYIVKPKQAYLRGEIYVGSTHKSKEEAFREDKCQYKLYLEKKFHYVTMFSLFEKYGVDNCEMEFIVTYDDISKEELRRREEAVRQRVECVNKNRAYRSEKDKIEYFRRYYQEHKEKWRDIYKKKSDTISKKNDC